MSRDARAVTLFADELSGWAGLLAGVGAWAGLLTLLYQRLGQRRCGGVVAFPVVIACALFAAQG